MKLNIPSLAGAAATVFGYSPLYYDPDKMDERARGTKIARTLRDELRRVAEMPDWKLAMKEAATREALASPTLPIDDGEALRNGLDFIRDIRARAQRPSGMT